jgi:type IV secretory pathway VirB4 component
MEPTNIARKSEKKTAWGRFFAKDLPYPIFSRDGNQLTAINGERSYCFKVIPDDLAQMDKVERLGFYQDIRTLLNSTSEKKWYKFYRWNTHSVFVNTNNESLEIPRLSSHELSEPEKSFLGDTDLFSDIDFFENYLTVNLDYWRLIHLQDMLPHNHESILDGLGCDYIVCFKKIGEEIAKKELNHKRRSQGLTLNTPHQNHEGEEAYDDANALLKDIISHGEGVFKVAVWLVPKAESLEELNQKTKELISQLRRKSVRAFIETDGLDFWFNNLLMGVRPSFLKSKPAESSYLANYLPLNRDYIHSEGMEVYSRSLNTMFLNLYDELASNQNWLLTGASGEGKSFLAGSLLYHLVSKEGVKAGIFDLGGSLRRVAIYLGGVDLSQSFNPLQFRCPYYLKRFILAVIGRGELTKQEEGRLFALIEEALVRKVPTFKELIKIVASEIDGVNWYFSELWDYFTEDIINPPDIFYIDTEGMPEQLITPYLVFAKELSESQDGKIVNYYDECWDLFDKCPEIVRFNAKTGRKNLIGNIFATQEIVELSNEYGDAAKAVIGNTYGKIYFYQPDLDHPILSDFEKDGIRSIKSKKGEYSEFFFSSPDRKKAARLYVAPLLYELCHSEKEHRVKQENFIEDNREFMSFRQAINKWVKAIYG